MKREILCPQCSLRLGAINPIKTVTALDAAMMAQEQVIKVDGILKTEKVCDFCSDVIKEGGQAVCCSIVPIGQSYYPWETDYITKP